MKKLLTQILKFGIVGGIAFVIDYGLLVLFTEGFHIYYFVSSLLSFSVSVIFNYIASIVWVFEVDNSKKKGTSTLIIFIALSVVGLGINQVVMWLGVEQFDISYLIIKFVATFIVMIYNFATRKLILERKSSS